MSLESKLVASLQKIGKSDRYTRGFLLLLREFEEKMQLRDGFSVRDEITGPIVDAIFSEKDSITRTLSNGLKITFSYKSKIARDFMLSEEEMPDHVWEPQTTKLLLALCKKAKNVLVGGAYWGDQALLVAQQIESFGRVHCFEANPETARFLEHNIAQNNIKNVEVLKYPLWDKDDVAVSLFGDDSLESLEEVSSDDHSMRTMTINTYCTNNGIERLDVLMLDIEGAELKALHGASKYLEMSKLEAPVVVFEVHRSYVDWSNGLCNTEIVQYLSSFGYSIYAVRDYNSNVLMTTPIELVPIDDVYLDGPAHGFNMIAIKEQSIIDSIGCKIVKGVSPKFIKHRDASLHSPI